MTMEQYRSLRKVLSYKVEGSYFSGSHNGGIKYLLAKDGSFASGLLERVIGWLEQHQLPYQHTDLRKRPTGQPGLFKATLPFKPYPEQLEAIRQAVQACRGTISMPTGSGKSITMALLIAKLNLKTLVIVPNLNLKLQLTESFTQIFGSLKNITIQNIDSGTLANAKDYDCLIIDEAHHVAASTYRKLNKSAWGKIYHRYFFTATPFRGVVEEQILMESIAGEVVYKLSYAQAVQAGMIVPIEAFYIDLPKVDVRGSTWPTVYKELIVNNEHRNRVIANLLASFQYAGVSTLCLVKEVAHGEKLKTSLIPFAHGENEETAALIKAFNKGGSCLIGTTGVLGEGVDSRPCEYVLIVGLGKSKPAFLQQCGRATRTYLGKESGKIIIFKDSSHKFTLTHFKAQVKILREEFGVVPVKLEIDK
jgi:superfamily II DNA or RNA helicase